MGSDTELKQELDSTILEMADLVVADSISQCIERGEISHALKDGKLAKNDIVELGDILNGQHPGRTSTEQITVADLTGVAVQDIQIATAVYESFMENET
jgi:ornithine cyclodeaminase